MKHPRQIAHTNKKYIAGHLELEEGRRIGIVNWYGFLSGVIKIFWIREPSNLMNIVKTELYIKVILYIHYCLGSPYENHFST